VQGAPFDCQDQQNRISKTGSATMHVTERIPSDKSAEANRLWADFLKARDRALGTLQIEDAARAGRAWAAFLAAFTVDAPPLVPWRPAQ
jgi:hypothetical protein